MSAEITRLKPHNPVPLEGLELLKQAYGLEDTGDIMKHALAIALIASKQADADGNIHFLKWDGTKTVQVIVPQRFPSP